MHYAFDKWMDRTHPDKPFARYADDGVIHCRTLEDAEELLESLKKRLEEVGLQLHPDKTRIVYCKDEDRKGNYPVIKFDFLGYTFRPRRAKNKYGDYFVTFSPAVSNSAKKAMRQTIRRWRLQSRAHIALEDIARVVNPVIRGWINYYGCFRKSELYSVLIHVNEALARWAKAKYKKLRKHPGRSFRYISRIARQDPSLLVHWKMGIVSTTG